MSVRNIMKFQTDRGLDTQAFDWTNETMNITEELLEAKGYDVPKNQRGFLHGVTDYIRARAATNPAITWLQPSKHDMVDAFADIIVFCIGAIMKLGYDPERVLHQVSKEINSRQGRIIKGKFEKYLPHQIGYEEPYKADFTGCTLDEK